MAQPSKLDTLKINRTGPTFNYDTSNTAFWKERSDVIKYIIVESGITTLRNYFFYNCTRIKTVQLPEGMVSISESCFFFNSHL